MTLQLERLRYPLSEVTVYTYGQPRMGNRVFCNLYDKKVTRSFRVFNESDIVVTMTMFGSYHVGIEVKVDRHGNFIIKPTEIEKMFPPTKGRGLAVLNHLMANYGTSMNRIAEKVECPARALQPYLTAAPEVWERHRKEEAMVAAASGNRAVLTGQEDNKEEEGDANKHHREV